MASVPNKLQSYLVKEISEEFNIKNTDTLNRWAAAVSRAIHTYITTDVEVKIGQQVEGTDSFNGTTIGKTVTPGDLF
jgi:hypothetical protein